MNLCSTRWIGALTSRDLVFYRTPPSGGFKRGWPYDILRELVYWRDFTQKHPHWAETKEGQ